MQPIPHCTRRPAQVDTLKIHVPLTRNIYFECTFRLSPPVRAKRCLSVSHHSLCNFICVCFKNAVIHLVGFSTTHLYSQCHFPPTHTIDSSISSSPRLHPMRAQDAASQRYRLPIRVTSFASLPYLICTNKQTGQSAPLGELPSKTSM